MRHPIQDEFTHLPISRQRKWQLRQMKAGRCPRCGSPKPPKHAACLCVRCLVEVRENNRRRVGSVKRHRSKSYRLQEQ